MAVVDGDGTTFRGRGCSGVLDPLTHIWTVTYDQECGADEAVIVGSAESNVPAPTTDNSFQYWSKTATGFLCGVVAGGSALAARSFSFIVMRRIDVD